MNTQQLIVDVCDEVRDLLLDKNRKYGDSALNPKRVFSKSPTDEQLNVRMDDKLSRIAAAQGDDREDAELDLLGYLILKRVYKRQWSIGMPESVNGDVRVSGVPYAVPTEAIRRKQPVDLEQLSLDLGLPPSARTPKVQDDE